MTTGLWANLIVSTRKATKQLAVSPPMCSWSGMESFRSSCPNCPTFISYGGCPLLQQWCPLLIPSLLWVSQQPESSQVSPLYDQISNNKTQPCNTLSINLWRENLNQTLVSTGNTRKTTITGTIVGVDVSASEKVWSTFQALGDIAFSYSYSMILIEIQVGWRLMYTKTFAMSFSYLLTNHILALHSSNIHDF